MLGSVVCVVKEVVVVVVLELYGRYIFFVWMSMFICVFGCRGFLDL